MSCAAVMSHLRGRLLAASVASFLSRPPEVLVDLPLASLPAAVAARLRADDNDTASTSISGLRFGLDTHALVVSPGTPGNGSRKHISLEVLR